MGENLNKVSNGVKKRDMATNTDNLPTADRSGRSMPRTVRERSLFVGGLGGQVSEADLRNYFSKYGNIIRVYMKYDSLTGMTRDYAFILFSDESAVHRAICKGHHFVNGRKLCAGRSKCRNNRVYITGLPWNATEDEIINYFSRFGDITDFQIPYNWQRLHRKSYCFISFLSFRTVLRLLGANVHYIRGKALTIRRATPRGDYFNSYNRATTFNGSGSSNSRQAKTETDQQQQIDITSDDTTTHNSNENNNNNTNNACVAADNASGVNNTNNDTMSLTCASYQQAATGFFSGNSLGQYAAYYNIGTGGVPNYGIGFGWHYNQPWTPMGSSIYSSVFGNGFMPTNGGIVMNNWLTMSGFNNFNFPSSVATGGYAATAGDAVASGDGSGDVGHGGCTAGTNGGQFNLNFDPNGAFNSLGVAGYSNSNDGWNLPFNTIAADMFLDSLSGFNENANEEASNGDGDDANYAEE